MSVDRPLSGPQKWALTTLGGIENRQREKYPDEPLGTLATHIAPSISTIRRLERLGLVETEVVAPYAGTIDDCYVSLTAAGREMIASMGG